MSTPLIHHTIDVSKLSAFQAALSRCDGRLHGRIAVNDTTAILAFRVPDYATFYREFRLELTKRSNARPSLWVRLKHWVLATW